MVVAFYGVESRSTASHLALLLSHVATLRGHPVDLIRLVGPGEQMLPPEASNVEDVRVVEMKVPCYASSAPLDRAITRSIMCGRTVVLDLPGACLTDAALSAREDVRRIVAVGSSRLQLRDAAALLGPRAEGAKPVLLLSHGRSSGYGGDDRLDATIARERGGSTGCRARVLHIAMPRFTSRELDTIVEGGLDDRSERFGQTLFDMLKGDPETSNPKIAYEGGDPRGMSERLRDLADDLDAHEAGYQPDGDDFLNAPLLDRWRPCLRLSPALCGEVDGHPTVRPGPTMTSEVFVSDGATYARTLSRLYRLGRPLGSDVAH